MMDYLLTLPMSKNCNLKMALQMAVEEKQLSAVKRLVATNRIEIATINYNIEIAARKGHIDILRFLHRQGGSILGIRSDYPEIKTYLCAQRFLQKHASQLQRLAARVYAEHHAKLPDADLIPVEMMKILICSKK